MVIRYKWGLLFLTVNPGSISEAREWIHWGGGEFSNVLPSLSFNISSERCLITLLYYEPSPLLLGVEFRKIPLWGRQFANFLRISPVV